MPKFIEIQKSPQLISLSDSAQLLGAMMLGVSDEVYVVDVMTMQFVYASESALKNTGYGLDTLKQQSLLNVLGVSVQTLQAHVDSQKHQQAVFIRLMQDSAPVFGDVGHDYLKAMVIQPDQKELVVIIKNYFSPASVSDCFACKEKSMQELSDFELRFHAMVSNTPGLFFQFQLDTDDEIKFIYLSEGCQALLGLTAEELKQSPKLFYALMNSRDRAALRKRLVSSAQNLSALDWEGRVWIDNWQDNKWINVRAIPRVLNYGEIQWEGIMINITQSKNEKHEIEESRRQLAELTTHLNQVKELERTRIAREIHDDLGGNLTAIKIGLASIIKRLDTGQPVSAEQAHRLESIIDNTFEAVHRISSDLRPNILDLGIVAALEWQAKEFEKQGVTPCQFTCNQVEIAVTQDQAIALFRICQESMSNIAKHADATKVSLDLTALAKEIVMTISDNGLGIKTSDTFKANSFGLRGMQERVAALHGSFNIDQFGERGTVVTVKLPIL